jgi:uracil-DNA glycosylase family 4
MDKKEELLKVWGEICACDKCDKIIPHIRNKVFGEGNVSSPIVFVGEAPGEEEDLAARPFVGAAGKILDQALAYARIRRERIMIINALKCRPTKDAGSSNRTPTWQEIQNCQTFLRRQLEILNPKVIVAMGKTAVAALFNKAPSSLKMSDVVGMAKEGTTSWCVPTYHPAYVAHRGNDPKLIQKIAKHLERAKEMVDAE